MIWEGYDKIDIELRLLRKVKMIFSEDLGRHTSTRTCLAGFVDYFVDQLWFDDLDLVVF